MDNGDGCSPRVSGYARLCILLCALGTRVGLCEANEKAVLVKKRRRENDRTEDSRKVGKTPAERRAEKLGNDLWLCGLALRPGQVLVAGKTLLVLMIGTGSLVTILLMSIGGSNWLFPCIMVTLIVPVLGREVLISYPSKLTSRAADEVLRTSSETTNLMIMSLRHEPSIPRAITFASCSDGMFSRELKRCAWGVIMGRFESFEEALIALGQKWSAFSDELKASLNAMVTASRESTEDGKRRALDRANNAMISGARRRIEEYALSLGMPSMVIFGLGILLPLMVGSFMPMLSWDLWSGGDLGQGFSEKRGSGASFQMVFVMNVLFPTIAGLVAANSVSGHPMRRGAGTSSSRKRFAAGLCAAAICSIAATSLAYLFLSGTLLQISILLSVIFPSSLWLVAYGRTVPTENGNLDREFEDELFRTGARMLEGENFESSLHHSASGVRSHEASLARRLSFSETIIGRRHSASADDTYGYGVSNARQGIRITRLAAGKDELAAGMLAMDLAAYLRDLRELESTLRTRLRPTISMMKATALLLAPIVLGVTYTIYLSLGSMIGGETSGIGSVLFFLVLGIFLAEMDVVVVYFVSGVGGGNRSESMAFTLGWYLMASEATFSATALLASM